MASAAFGFLRDVNQVISSDPGPDKGSLIVNINTASRSLERDVKRVHEDVATLIEIGLVEKTELGRIRVPFTVIEADFQLRAA